MDMKITQEKENKFLERKEVKGTLQFVGTTPSNKTIQEELSKKYSAEKENVIVKKIHTTFGLQEGTINAVVYANEKARKRSEQLTKHQKPKKVEEKKE